MVHSTTFPLTLAVTVALTVWLSVLVAGGWGAAAQDPVGQPARPAYLQQGTCADPGDVLAALAVIGEDGAGDDAPTTVTPDPTEAPDPLTVAIPASVSVTEISTSLEDLLAAPLIVRIAESADAPDRDVACGVVAGTPDEDGNVYVALSERNDSGLTGIAWLQEDGDRTTVTLFAIPTPPGPTSRADR